MQNNSLVLHSSSSSPALPSLINSRALDTDLASSAPREHRAELRWVRICTGQVHAKNQSVRGLFLPCQTTRRERDGRMPNSVELPQNTAESGNRNQPSEPYSLPAYATISI